jgi:hypothetical protein
MSVIESAENPLTGEVRDRYVNKSRFVGYNPIAIGHTHSTPIDPPLAAKEKVAQLDQAIVAKLNKVCRSFLAEAMSFSSRRYSPRDLFGCDIRFSLSSPKKSRRASLGTQASYYLYLSDVHLALGHTFHR